MPPLILAGGGVQIWAVTTRPTSAVSVLIEYGFLANTPLRGGR